MSLLDKLKFKTYNLSKACDLARSREIEQQEEADDETYDMYFNCQERRRSDVTVRSDCTFDAGKDISNKLERRRNSIATTHCIIFPGAPRRTTVSFFEKIRKKVGRTPSGRISPDI